jgi:hypothetical protein
MSDTGVMNLNGANINAGVADVKFGFVYQDVTIPPGSTITSCVMDVYLPNASYDDPNLIIQMEAADTVSTFGSNNYNMDRPLTTSYVIWNQSSIGTGWIQTPDFASVLQDVIDRPGWASGNDISVIMTSLSGCNVRINAYDNGNSTQAALSVVYSEGGGLNSKMAHYRRMRR